MYLVKNKLTTARALYQANQNVALLLFGGNIPQTLEDINFDHTDLKNCLLNSLAVAQFGSIVPHPVHVAQHIDFTPTSWSDNWAPITKLHHITPNKEPSIGGHNLPVKYVDVVRIVNGESKSAQGSYLFSKIQSTLSSNMVLGSRAVNERTCNYLSGQTNTAIEYDFGEIQEVDGFTMSNYTRQKPLNESRYLYLEYLDGSGNWVEFAPAQYMYESNIDKQSSGVGYTSLNLGKDYSETYSNLYRVTFDSTISTSKVRVRFGGKEASGETRSWQTRAFTFFTNQDVSDKVNEEHEITWAMFVPMYRIDNVVNVSSMEFQVLPVGKQGVDDPLDYPILMAETTLGPLTGSVLPEITQCKLNTGLL